MRKINLIVSKLNFSQIILKDYPDTKKESKKLKRGMNIEMKIGEASCMDDESVLMWNCQVCLQILRLQIRLDYGLLASKNKF